MSERYPGGLIRKTPPTVTGPTGGEGGSAPGIWTLEEVAYYEKAGLWPSKLLPRQLYSFGSGFRGSLGLNISGASAYRSSPTQVGSSVPLINDFSIEVRNSAAIRSGSLFTWGYNSNGELGLGDRIARSSPVQVGALTNWSKVSFGEGFCVAIKDDGTMWSWGQNNYGQLAQNDTTNRSSPVQVGTQTYWTEISTAVYHVVARGNSNRLWSWGRNSFGNLGQNTGITVHRSSPVQVGSQTDWDLVDAKGNSSFGIRNGALYGWGANDGQLGLTDKIYRSSPTQVGALTTWATVSGGNKFSAFINNSGELWVTGQNDEGQLGLNLTVVNTYRSSPVQVGTGTDWSKVYANRDQCGAVKTDGTLWTWGKNNSGQLGHDDKVNRSSPVQVGTGTDWVDVALSTQEQSLAVEKVT